MAKLHHDTHLTHTQIRIGKNKKAIRITKLRTMRKNSHSEYDSMKRGLRFSEEIAKDHRTNTFGKFIRKSKLDELPQISNLIRRELILVGLRPMPRQEYRKLQKKERELYDKIGPGLFGIQYAIPKKQRTSKKVLELANQFYNEYKLNKKKTIVKWLAKIIKNVYQ